MYVFLSSDHTLVYRSIIVRPFKEFCCLSLIGNHVLLTRTAWIVIKCALFFFVVEQRGTFFDKRFYLLLVFWIERFEHDAHARMGFIV